MQEEDLMSSSDETLAESLATTWSSSDMPPTLFGSNAHEENDTTLEISPLSAGKDSPSHQAPKGLCDSIMTTATSDPLVARCIPTAQGTRHDATAHKQESGSGKDMVAFNKRKAMPSNMNAVAKAPRTQIQLPRKQVSPAQWNEDLRRNRDYATQLATSPSRDEEHGSTTRQGPVEQFDQKRNENNNVDEDGDYVIEVGTDVYGMWKGKENFGVSIERLCGSQKLRSMPLSHTFLCAFHSATIMAKLRKRQRLIA